MSLRTWLQMFVTAGAVAWNVGLVNSASAQPSTPPGAGTAPATQLPDVDVQAPTTTQPPVNLQPNFEPFNQPTILTDNAFAASPVSGYNAPSATTGSLINMPALAYPGAVNTITEDLRRDQQAINFSDIVRNIGGAVQGFGNGGDGERRPDAFLMRGFEMTSQNFRKNGFLDPTYTPRDFANVDRVDVIKGPASVIYGSALPTGTVNVITKRALQDRFAVGTFTTGSWDLQRYTVDANNMSANGNVLFRINAAYQNMNSFRDYSFNERTFVAPTATWLVSDRTAIVFEAEVNHSRRLYDTGIVAINGDTQAVPFSRFYGVPGDYFKNHDYRGMLSLTHQINDDWSFYLGGSTLFFDFQNQGTQPTNNLPFFDFNTFTVITPPTTGPGGFFTNNPAGQLARRQFLGGQQGSNQALIANLNGKWNGPLFRHNSVIGTEQDWMLNKADFPASIAGIPLGGGFYTPPIDNPLLINPAAPGPYLGTTTHSFDFRFNGLYQQRNSVYFQDLVEITDRLKLMAGVRWDHIHQTSQYTLTADTTNIGGGPNTPFYTTPIIHQDFNQGTPRVALIYDLIPDYLSLYSLYTTSFNPIGGNAFGAPGAGANTDPELGRIYEAGFKAQLRSNLLYTFSAFQIDRQNVAVQPDSGFTYLQANQRSKGIEMNLIGNWTERLSTVSNYSYTDVNQTDPNGGPEYDINGRVRGVPYNLANTWTRYNLVQNRNQVYGVGLGYVFVGDRRGDYGGTRGSPLVLGDYSRWDLGFFGQQGRWNMNAYVENFLDTRYIAGSTNQYQLYPGAPINLRFQIGASF